MCVLVGLVIVPQGEYSLVSPCLSSLNGSFVNERLKFLSFRLRFWILGLAFKCLWLWDTSTVSHSLRQQNEEAGNRSLYHKSLSSFIYWSGFLWLYQNKVLFDGDYVWVIITISIMLVTIIIIITLWFIGSSSGDGRSIVVPCQYHALIITLLRFLFLFFMIKLKVNADLEQVCH